ncbi:methionyl-tRNA formyltransferase [Burkholderiaceae bacterium DAT-1]|nr:methionyl-tRNA formyltransferase [Burkholderiaceae bacterium DAT-1]
MKLIFAGTPEFAATALDALMRAGHEIVMVLTQPDRPSGRGMKLTPSPVKQLALQHNLPVYQPEKLRTEEQQAPLRTLDVDAIIVAAYGIILPQAVLDLPRRGCINIHASLLPRWRGAAPIHRAIESGDAETGITIMQMDAGLDTGAMLSMHRLPIAADDTTASLHDKLATLGGDAIVSTLAQLNQLNAIAQPAEGVTYAEKIRKDEAHVDWTLPATVIERRLRAFNPFPALCSTLNEETIKFWRGTLVQGSGKPGEILSAGPEGIVVACGEGAINLTELQRPGGKRLSASALLTGLPLVAGMQFFTLSAA